MNIASKNRKKIPPGFSPALFLLLWPWQVWAEPQVVCQYHYGGEDKEFTATATTDPYGVVYQEVGTWFVFKIVFRDTPEELATVKIYVAGSGRDGPVPVHQATYGYPAATISRGPHGFTGLNHVYEPELSGEFIYWCRMAGEQP